MKIVLRVALALGAMALVGCGGRPLAAGKEAAAAALFQSSRGATGAQGGLAEILNSGAGIETEVKVSCPRGGMVAVRVEVDSSSQTGVSYDLVYDNCNYDGRTSLRGTLQMTFEVVSGGSSVAMALHLQGRVDFSGEISDFIDVNVTETVAVSDLDSPSGTVSITLTGSITNSTGTYTYDNETIVVSPELQAAPDPS